MPGAQCPGRGAEGLDLGRGSDGDGHALSASARSFKGSRQRLPSLSFPSHRLALRSNANLPHSRRFQGPRNCPSQPPASNSRGSFPCPSPPSSGLSPDGTFRNLTLQHPTSPPLSSLIKGTQAPLDTAALSGPKGSAPLTRAVPVWLLGGEQWLPESAGSSQRPALRRGTDRPPVLRHASPSSVALRPPGCPRASQTARF